MDIDQEIVGSGSAALVITPCIQGKAWYSYVDPEATLDQLKKLTSEFLAIFDKCPSKLKKKILQSHNEVG